MDYNKLIGRTLDDLMKQKQWTFNNLAQKTGFTRSYLSKIVSGKMPKLPVGTLEKIVSALDYKMSDFMELVEKKNLLLT